MSQSTQEDTNEKAPEASPGTESKRKFRRRLLGRVASNKMSKTVIVEVVRYQMHSMYRKYVKVRKRYKAHDEKNEYLVGDRVEIVEHRPLSKHKRWRVARLIERGVQD